MSGVLANVVQTLSKIAPVFPLRASQAKILHEPHEFYEALLTGIRNAKKRIVITSLYLGTGKLEQQIVRLRRSQNVLDRWPAVKG